MKRVLLSIVGTVAGLVALLSFKSQGHPLPAAAGGLPSAGLPESSPSSTQAPATGGATTPAPTRDATPKNPSSAARTAAEHTYLGSAVDTRYGIVQVRVVVAGTRITNVSFAQLTAFDGRSQEINSQAAPILLQETLTAQSAHIDTVSGATYTTDGYEQSLQSALDQAGIR